VAGTLEEDDVRKWQTLGLCASAALMVGCGSPDRTIVSAPSSVPPASAASLSVLHPLDSSTPIVVTALVAGTSCPNLQFMVYTYTFKVTASTQYTGGTCANLQTGSRINFTGSRESETSQVFTVSALTFATSTPPPTTPPPSTAPSTVSVQTDGVVTSIGAGMCPELQFFFTTYAFNVSTATQYSGGACRDIAVGARVALTGTKKDGENFIRVSSLTFRSDTGTTTAPTSPTGPTTPSGRPVDGEGVITTLATNSSCPALSFYIGSYLVKLTSSTTFDHGACSDLAAGVRVHVVGSISDTTVTASQVSVVTTALTPQRQTVAGEGRVTSLVQGSSCPSLVVMIQEYTVAFDSATTFAGGACGDVAAGSLLGVQGVVTGDKQVLATSIVIKTGQ